MGFCGTPTTIFDAIAEHLIEHSTATTDDKIALLVKLIEVLEAEDWDCQSDSSYLGDPLVQAAFVSHDPEWAVYFNEAEDEEREDMDEEGHPDDNNPRAFDPEADEF